jgi:F-type H+-transporting ATPase subunit epsilon
MADAASSGKVAFELVSPERLLASEEVDMVVAPGVAGDFGVLPEHSPLMSLLRPGVLEIYEGDQGTQRIFVGGGFAEVNEKGCIVLAEEAMPLAEIDVEAAERRIRLAKDDLTTVEDDVAKAKLERDIEIAEAMIEAAKGGGGAH